MNNTFAIIDLGSTALRFQILQIEANNKLKSLTYIRIPIRLGDDSFTQSSPKIITDSSIEKLKLAFVAFYNIASLFQVQKIIAVGTSALRQATNNQFVIDVLKSHSQIKIVLLSAISEAYYTHLSIKPYISNLKGQALHFDLGGGSIEFNRFDKNNLLESISFDIGTVRLLQNNIIQQSWDELKHWLEHSITHYQIKNVYATGGGLFIMLKLIQKILDVKHNFINLADILLFIEKIAQNRNLFFAKLDLSSDRKELVESSLEIIKFILQNVKNNSIFALNTGLINGIVFEHDKF